MKNFSFKANNGQAAPGHKFDSRGGGLLLTTGTFFQRHKIKEKKEKSSAQQQQVHINRQRSMIAIMNSLDS